MNISVHVVILTLLSLCRSLAGCPSICTCNITHTNCSSNNLLLFDWLLNQISSNITNLSLSRNNITTINSTAFTNLTSLLQLDLSRNNITTINTTAFTNLISLLQLDLSRNNITTINTTAFTNLTRLLQLDLSRNQLLTLHSSTFSHLSNLEVLDLSSNLLENLPMDLFSKLSRLRKLVLSNNSLKELKPKQFQNLPELQHLDISFNNLTSLNSGILEGVQGLEWLSLAGNKLTLLERSMLEPHTVLQILLLEGNQWNCSCTLMPFRHWLEWMLYRGGSVDAIKCSFPAVLQGQDLRSIPTEMFKHCSEPPFPNSRNPPSTCTDNAEGLLVSSDSTTTCLEQRPRTMNLRRAPTTIVLARLVCGVVWLMMVVAAMYGCIYAMLAAKHQQGLLKQRLQLTQRPLMENEPKVDQEEEDEDEIKADLNRRAKTQELTEWIALPPEVCV